MNPATPLLVLGSGTLPANDELPIHLRGFGHAIDWRIGSTRIGGFPFTPHDVVMTEVGLIDAAIRGAREGACAILLDTYGEYGIDAMRSALGIPIVGAAEAAIAEARAIGGTFGIVTVWPASMEWLYERQAARLGIQGSCVGVRYVGGEAASFSTPMSTLHAMHRGDEGWRARIESASNELIGLGASSIVLGCTCMAPLWEPIADRSAVPVICSARAGARAVVSAFERARRSSRPAPAIPESAARLVEWVDAAAPAFAAESAACPVCLVAAD